MLPPQEESKLVADASGSAAPDSPSTSDKGKQPEVTDVGKQLTPALLQQLLAANPGLASEFSGQPEANIEDLIRRMKLEDMLTGVVSYDVFPSLRIN